MIRPANANNAGLGKNARDIQFAAWGNEESQANCIEFNATQARHEYFFDCVREYAIHEFGHLAGAPHEWRHPDTPQGCIDDLPERTEETVIPFADYTRVWSSPARYFIPSLSYDFHSIMVYEAGSSACATVSKFAWTTKDSHHRFGSSEPNDNDYETMAAAYPPLAPESGDVPVGVIPDREDDCPELRRVGIFMDDEDLDNKSYSGGWTGASLVEGGNTSLRLCRVNGADLRPMEAPARGRSDYAVLKLGPSCPTGAVDVVRTHENEGDHNFKDRHGQLSGETVAVTEQGLNRNWMAGPVGPTDQNFAPEGPQTRLHWCFFPQAASSAGTMSEFPDFGFAYGVLAPGTHPFAAQTGYIHSDDEDKSRHSALEPSDQAAAFDVVGDFDNNTTYSLIKVGTAAQLGPWLVLANRPQPNDQGWYQNNVTVTWTCYRLPTDFLGDGDPPISDVTDTITDEGLYRSATGECEDEGRSASATEFNFNIDKTNPVIAYKGPEPDANEHGWHRTDVTAIWTCTDPLSGAKGTPWVIPNIPVVLTTTITGEGKNRFATAECADNAGNSVHPDDSTAFANIDRTAPTVARESALPQPNANGWFTSDVTYSWKCRDMLSAPEGVRDDILDIHKVADVTKTFTDGRDQIPIGDCTDNAGNIGHSEPDPSIDVDTVKPGIALKHRPSPNTNGWYSSDVTIEWTCSDATSGPVDATVSDTVATEGANRSATGTCKDVAGHTNSATETGINLDETPPEIELLSRPNANENGWYDGDVTIKWSCSDALSGEVTEIVEATVSSEGADREATGTCTDKAGNTAQATETQHRHRQDKPGDRAPEPAPGQRQRLVQRRRHDRVVVRRRALGRRQQHRSGDRDQ